VDIPYICDLSVFVRFFELELCFFDDKFFIFMVAINVDLWRI
jgi:hypothetical protein